MGSMTKVEVPILNNEYWVHVIWGKKEECEKYLRKHFKEDYTQIFENIRGQTLWRNNCEPVIYMEIKPKQEHFWATLAHEACHAIDDIFEYVSEDSHPKEIYAHSVGAILSHVEGYLKKNV